MAEPLDLRGLKCPLPALFAKRALLGAPRGACIEIVTDDPLEVIPGLLARRCDWRRRAELLACLCVTGTDTVLADSYTYAAFEVLDDRSTARVPDGADTWQLFDARTPYTGTTPPLGTGCEPTPGASNACPTAVDRLEWGAIKKLYDGPAVRR